MDLERIFRYNLTKLRIYFSCDGSTARKSSFRLALATSLVMLGACQRPPLSQAENDRIDDAMARVKIEQDRTDQAEVRKQAEVLRQAGAAAEAREKRLVQATPARAIQPNWPLQNFPADVRPSLPPDPLGPAGSGR